MSPSKLSSVVLVLVFTLAGLVFSNPSFAASKVFDQVKTDLQAACDGSKTLEISTIKDLANVSILKSQKIGKAKFFTKEGSLYITGEMGVGVALPKDSEVYSAIDKIPYIGKAFADSLQNQSMNIVLTITETTSVASGKDLLWNISWILEKATWNLPDGGKLELKSFTIAYANLLQGLKKSSMPPEVQKLFKILDSTGDKLTLKQDVSLFAVSSLSGCKAQQVLGKFIPALDGSADLLFNTNLTWPLNQIALRFQIPAKFDLGKGFKLSPPALVMVLPPNMKEPLKIGFDITLTVDMPPDATPLDFTGMMLVPAQTTLTSTGVSFLLAMAVADKPWENAMGLSALTVHSLKFLIQLGAAGKTFGFQGKMNIADHLIDIAGLIPPTGIGDLALSGKLDKLSMHDIFGWLASLNGDLKKFIGKLPLKEIILKNLQVTVSSVENRTLGLTDGITMTGDVELFGQKASGAELRTLKTSTTVNKLITGYYLKAWVKKFKVGPLEIDGVGPDMKPGTGDDGPHFESRLSLLEQFLNLTGRVKVFGSFVEVVFGFGLTDVLAKTEIKIADKFNVLLDIGYSINFKDPKVWFQGRFKQDFYKHLTESAVEALKKAQKKAEEDEKKAKGALSDAQDKVKTLDTNINDREKSFNEEQKKAQDALDGAKKKVATLQDKIDDREKEVEKSRKGYKKKFDDANDDVKSAEKKVNKLNKQAKEAKKDLDDAPWYRKADKGAKYAGIKTAYGVAKGALIAAEKVLDGIKKGGSEVMKADPELNSLKASKKTAEVALDVAKGAVALRPLKGDPKYLALIAAKETALGSLELAKKSVGLYGMTSQACLRLVEKIVKEAASFEIKYVEFKTATCAETSYFKLSLECVLDEKKVVLKDVGFDFSPKEMAGNTLKLLKEVFSKASEDAQKAVKYFD